MVQSSGVNVNVNGLSFVNINTGSNCKFLVPLGEVGDMALYSNL